jgi:hypothetical protein
MLLAILGVAPPLPAEGPGPDRAKALTQLKALARRVVLDERKEGKPVVDVSFYSSPVTDDQLALLKEFPELRQLDLQYTKVSDRGLAHLAGLTQLEYLCLYQCTGFTDAGLAHLKKLTKLRELLLNGTKVSDGAVKHLAGLTSLEHVYLGGGTKVTPEGYRSLRQKLPKTKFSGLKPEIDEPAPPFTGKTTEGKKIALADYRGKRAVLLVFYENG